MPHVQSFNGHYGFMTWFIEKPRCWWIIVSVSDTAEMMEKSSGNGFSIGLGLTNDCNLACAHCYRDTGRIDRLSLAQVRTICECLPIGSMGFGTGENALHP